MQVNMQAIKANGLATATQVRNGLHAFGTAHPFAFGTLVLLAAEVLAHFHVHF